ncbi:MAG TPA: PLP-dependent aminotransferase family protein [Rhodothermales bacterium]|nr:PLP-dependent aminotransferase family protein [Rhodothermales bacterium]
MPRRNQSPLIILHERTGAEEAASAPPLYRQLYARLRDLILEEQLGTGDRLPSSRALARDLSISRTTVELAFDQLLAEGFIERRPGSGTFVAAILPDPPRPLPDTDHLALAESENEQGLSQQGHRLLATPLMHEQGPALPGLAPCRPGADVFPIDLWNRILARTVREQGHALQHTAPPEGDPMLRDVLAAHLARTRSVQCSPEQIVVTTSTQQALDVLARLLLDPGDPVWIEEPGYLGARTALHAAGGKLVPVPVDAEGIDIDAGRRRAPEARLAYVTPSHQYPSGVTLSIARRLDLLQWATQANAWIIEDDYDSEFRYTGRPLAPLQSIDSTGHVIYLGTFNKALFAGLRLGYAVLPPVLVRPFTRALEASAGPVSTLQQAVLSIFIADGHFVSHLRRSRERYRVRRDALLEAVETTCADLLRLGPLETGLHVCAYLPDAVSDIAVSAQAAGAGLYVPPLSACYLTPAQQSGLILGYGGTDVEAICQGMKHLAHAIRQAGRAL